ncbi:hypothetical protein C8T65DRAFT_179523 [Cerioporus squamosus]|nr:hypothetical protein C8T65DRAFT_179523 [Cerioporus squamosus]
MLCRLSLVRLECSFSAYALVEPAGADPAVYQCDSHISQRPPASDPVYSQAPVGLLSRKKNAPSSPPQRTNEHSQALAGGSHCENIRAGPIASSSPLAPLDFEVMTLSCRMLSCASASLNLPISGCIMSRLRW